MGEFLNFLLLTISQFAGGPGAMENNLVRFLFPAVTYGALMFVAWSRQRGQDLPREKLLVWGFGLGSASAFLMAVFVSLQLLNLIARESTYVILVPLERALAMASVIVVAGAFLRYILEDARLARTYLLTGLGITLLCLLFAWWQWPTYYAELTEKQFHTSMVSWTFQVFTSLLILIAITLIQVKRGWLSNLVTLALLFFLASEMLFLVNYATDKRYNSTLCPIGNSFPLLAILLLGYVYLREQTLEKQRVQNDLELHRHHLEDLVNQRTEEIANVNARLQEEVHQRQKAQDALEQLTHKYELILETAGEGICGIDCHGRFVFVNPAAADILGYRVAELVGQPSQSTWCGPQIEPHQNSGSCPVYMGFTYGISNRGEDQLFWRKDGSSFPVFYVSNPTYENGTLTGSVVVFKDITERKRAEAELAQSNINLAAQNAIADSLSRSLDLETTLDHALDAVLSIVPMEVGLIFLWDPESDELVLQNYRGPILQTEAGKRKQEWNCCAMISRETMKQLEPVIKLVQDCPAANASLMVVMSGLETLVSVPLLSGGKTHGALTLGSKQREPVKPPELELLAIIGQQIGMAIENASLYRKAERAAEELTLLHQMSVDLNSTFSTETIYQQIVKRSVKLLNCPMACILDWEKEEQKVILIAGHGFTNTEEEILLARQDWTHSVRDLIGCEQSTIIQDIQTDNCIPDPWREILGIKALLCVPIRGMDRSLGTLFLMDREVQQPWRDEKRVLVESFVNRAAVALMNAELHKQLEWAAALEERQRIAADMHDGLAQTVSLLGLQIDQAMDLVKEGRSQQALDELSLTRETVKHVSTNVRQSIASLQRPPQPRRSLQQLLTGVVEQLTRENGPLIELVCNGQEALFLPQEQGNQAMFIVQEALLNAHRHAHARQIKVTVDRQEHDLLIRVEDNGLGFVVGAWWETSQDHFGLGIMHSRAARIGAQLKIDSMPGQGTRVMLTLPLSEKHDRGKSTSPSQLVTSELSLQQGSEP